MSTLDELALDVDRLESLRDVKDLQRSYAHFGQLGRWAEMTELFAADALVQWRGEVISGTTAISSWLQSEAGACDGHRVGTLRTEVIEQPLVNLSPDGLTAAGRWNLMRFLGDGQGAARLEAGVLENDYILEGDRWRIAALRFHPLYEGDYRDGPTATGGVGMPLVAPHFTVDETGIPIPAATGPAPTTTTSAAALAGRIARLNDEDDVRNLQHAFGYYTDRKMWSDAIDLFAPDDARMSVRGKAEHIGLTAIRAALESQGPEGLDLGQLNDRPIFDLIVEVDVATGTAVARGIEIGMLGDTRTGSGSWEFSFFTTRFVKADGLWRIISTTSSPLLTADYANGWGSGGTAETHQPTFLPGGIRGQREVDESSGAALPDLADLRRRLGRSWAFDGAENVSSAYGYYLDDFQWEEMAGIFAREGNKQSPFAGYYLGREHISGAASTFYGGSRPLDSTRERLSSHWRTQPVIMVSHDARSANIRTRLFQPRAATVVTPDFTGFAGAMYPNDQAVLEDGVWRLWTLTIDEHYFNSPTWAGGWASAEERPTDAPNPPPSRLVTDYPPDILLTELGERTEGFRGGPGRTLVWPEILPMWFSYRNPVSGRVPERYWPDAVTARLRPETSLTAHGYQLPPTGPAIDGVDIALIPGS